MIKRLAIVTTLLLVGVLIALASRPTLRTLWAIQQIASSDTDAADRGWHYLLEVKPSLSDREKDAILNKASEMPSGRMVDAFDRLRSAGVVTGSTWLDTWEMEARIERASEVDAEMIVEILSRSSTWDVSNVAAQVLTNLDLWPDQHDELVGAVLSAGPNPAKLLYYIDGTVPQTDTSTWRTFLLAGAWDPTGEHVPVLENDDLTDAALYAQMRWSDTLFARQFSNRMPLLVDELSGLPTAAAILRFGEHESCIAALATLAEDGDPAARAALARRDSDTWNADAVKIAANDGLPRWQRCTAAWRSGRLPPALRETFDQGPLAGRHGHVYGSVLLAERFLSRAEAVALAEQWLRSFDDDRKRAGALLAGLLGEHLDLLRAAYEAENVGAVRTAQRNALPMLGVEIGPEDDRELTWRSLRAGPLDVDPDVLLALLARGDVDALAVLTEQPRGDDLSASARARAWLLDRFFPELAEWSRWPLPTTDATRFHFETLEAVRKATIRQVEFDEDERVFELGEISDSW